MQNHPITNTTTTLEPPGPDDDDDFGTQDPACDEGDDPVPDEELGVGD